MTGWPERRGQAQRIALLNSPGTADDLITGSAGTREKMAVMAIATVDPWSEGREVSADRLQDSGTMHRVQRVGDVNRDSNLGRVQALLVKPLAGSVDDGFAAIGGLDAELKRLNGQCVLGLR